jgi:hypothetical protein
VLGELDDGHGIMGKGKTIPWHHGLGWQIKQLECDNVLVYFKRHHILIYKKYSC